MIEGDLPKSTSLIGKIVDTIAPPDVFHVNGYAVPHDVLRQGISIFRDLEECVTRGTDPSTIEVRFERVAGYKRLMKKYDMRKY
ncbi:hypothetical protein ACFL2C_02605 [Patescibacteria group bacterium]